MNQELIWKYCQEEIMTLEAKRTLLEKHLNDIDAEIKAVKEGSRVDGLSKLSDKQLKQLICSKQKTKSYFRVKIFKEMK